MSHLPPHGLEDAHEFFRQGDDGEYIEPEATEEPLLEEVGGSRDWAQLEHQLERRARYARWVTGLMVALSLATVLAFAVRSTGEHDSPAGLTSTESAPRLLRPAAPQRRPVSSPARSTPRIESAKNEPVSAAPAPALAASQRSEPAEIRAPSVRSSRVRRAPRAQLAPQVQPRSAESSARPYRPPTARFED